MPPLMLQALPGVTKIPLFPKAGKGFDPAVTKAYSTVTVAFDKHYRLIVFSSLQPQGPKKKKSNKLHHEQLRAALPVERVEPLRPPATAEGAAALAPGGIPAVCGVSQAKNKRQRARV